ncbi:Hypothetical predicted protein [Olea europaea subsp. europaea]|uniref:PWWP domain-containing protein n=1 Tax=Olea europaea subsp. europaea TaxID=158383 RepID=A0A8S0UAG3_OLEEU|nr:Hypothetical predicted protein [Olea europaea subsp. europaea]
MGSSETGVDCSARSIVWVRRRNGSWWPGKIIGTDELSASHITSPRSGTPVKLLGREDASVDWYNLEKSKRVKAFRCGEFDECIERAEAVQGMPPKKREKYARREDAILHALELERQLLETSGKVGYASNDRIKKSEDVTSSGHYENGSGNQIDPRSLQVSESLGRTVAENHVANHMHGDEEVREGNQLRGDYDNAGVLPRMRGLQDVGLRSGPLMHKLSPAIASNVSLKPVVISTPALPNDAFSADDKVNPNIEKMSDDEKSLAESLPDESVVRRRDRQRPLIQVLEKSAKLPVPDSQPDDGSATINTSEEGLPGVSFRAKRGRSAHLATDSDSYLNNYGIHSSQIETSVSKFEESDKPHSADYGDEHTSGSTEDTETDSSGNDSLESDSDDEMTAISDGSASIELQPKYPRRIEEQGSMTSDDLEELEFGDDVPRSFRNNPLSASMGVSRWQLKGKRNNRGLMKRSDAEVSGGYIYRGRSNWSSSGKKSDLIERSFRTGMPGYRSTCLPDGLARNDQSSMRGYWDDSLDPLSAQHHFGGSTLLDVDLKVQANNYRRDVPIISMQSKLNGRAIIGHPIQVEALESGSSENFLPATNHFYPETSENHMALTPIWSTARRTANFRVPRPHVSSAMSSESKPDLQVVVDQDKQIPFGHPQHLDRRFPRNSPRKINPSSNQKTRTLSSIASEPKHSIDHRIGGNNYQADGLMKTQDVPTTVACIPVKLVFSRLHEEFDGYHQ